MLVHHIILTYHLYCNYNQQIQKQLGYQKKTASKGGEDIDLDEDDRKKVSTLLSDIFRNQVPTDWDKRKDLYNIALDVSRILSSNEILGTIWGAADDQEGVLYWLLDFNNQAKDILKRHESGYSKEDKNDVDLATQVSEVADAALKISRRCVAAKPIADLSVISMRERYQSKLGPLRFDSVDSMQNHFFLKKSPSAPSTLNTRLLFKELAAYRTALPVEYGSSCFCRVINNRLDMLRVMITGPDETPYANGCFMFDISMPANYPTSNPKVQFLTTGGGRIRFNPNLYNCGKVCLSLLGTWAGPGWIAGQSTLLQVLISIQSLILVPDPYFNEPCYDRQRGTPQGDAQSKAYNKSIRGHTLSAAIESHLTAILNNNNPYVEFEPVMIKHFLEKRSLIQKEMWSWVKGDGQHLGPKVSKICNLLEQLDNRERSSKSKRKRAAKSNEPIDLSDEPRAKAAKSNNEPITLDDSDEDEQKKPAAAQLKSNETIEIDISSDDDDKKEKKSEKPAAVKKKKAITETIEIDLSSDEETVMKKKKAEV